MVPKFCLSLAIASLTVQLLASGCAAETSTLSTPPPPSRKSTAGPGSKPATTTTKPQDFATATASAKSGAPTKSGGETKPTAATGKKPRAEVLNPDQFFGMAMIGYAAAKAAPEVMENLFCYCGCDLTDSHTSLLDCFTSIHGVDCHICQDEAQIALKLHKQGVPMVKIQQQIDEEFAKQYPFEEDTPTYKNYKAHRLWVKGGTGSGSGSTGTASEGAKPDQAGSGRGPDLKNPKLKPGAKAGNCCGGKHETDKAK